MSTTDPATATVAVARYVGSGGASAEDAVVVEEPLEIRVSGDTIAVTMRTPGHERDLALGFLFAEGLVQAADDVASVAFCGRPGDASLRDTLEVTPRAGGWLERAPRDPARRGTVTTAACGVCGRVQIDDLLERLPVLAPSDAVPIGVVTGAVRALRGEQTLFAQTGGCHGADSNSRSRTCSPPVAIHSSRTALPHRCSRRARRPCRSIQGPRCRSANRNRGCGARVLAASG